MKNSLGSISRRSSLLQSQAATATYRLNVELNIVWLFSVWRNRFLLVDAFENKNNKYKMSET